MDTKIKPPPTRRVALHHTADATVILDAATFAPVEVKVRDETLVPHPTRAAGNWDYPHDAVPERQVREAIKIMNQAEEWPVWTFCEQEKVKMDWLARGIDVTLIPRDREEEEESAESDGTWTVLDAVVTVHVVIALRQKRIERVHVSQASLVLKPESRAQTRRESPDGPGRREWALAGLHVMGAHNWNCDWRIG